MNSLELGDETISKRAQVCLDLYEECHAICVGLDNRLGGKASEEDNHCNDGEAPIASLVENQLGRFNIWTSNIGVFATLKLSLDYRLRDASDIRDLVLRLLDSLFGNLQQLLHVLNRAHLMPASDDNRQSRANISSAINTISDNVDRLHRLSNSIRRAGAESRNMRAAEFEWKDDDGSDLGRPWMEHFAMALLQFKYPESSETIRRRLASAMLLRRKRLLYRQARQEKLVLAAVHASRKKIAPVKKLVASKASSKPGPQQQLNLPNNVETDEPKVAQSVRSFNTAATPLDPEKFQRAVAPSRVSTAKSAPLTEETKLNFPPPPLPIKDGRKEVLCPYCGLLMPVREVENLLTWRNHVLKDLDPYVCLFENCSKENQLYNSVKDWLCHMKFKHRLQWRCAVKVHSKETARIFNLQKDFEDHMKKFHEGTFTEAQLPLLVESSARPVTPIFETCPLCDPKGLQDPERENQLTPDELEKHIINHLVFLAVKSIPWPENVGEAASSNSSARTKTRETIQNDLDHGMQPDFEDITYNSPERLHDDSENFANNIDEIRLHDSYPGHHLDPKLRAFIEKVPISGELLGKDGPSILTSFALITAMQII
ncbi:hypothetical protein AOQ84DRAFT_416491 [Glonium stellatum]|uniref:Uncharacterized protein n=1 Tax=Glonium stellatum TaxID=574774 RepID=A0A8E2FAT8_9PEZI|nr:hypothetical protein AOQ84DRAFT_416491 [Glonium stellatum]